MLELIRSPPVDRYRTLVLDLLSNPFAILNLTGDADSGAISARAREIATPEAAAASRLLLVPRTRLQSEVRYLPGASPEIAGECLKALRAGHQPDLRPLFPLALANVLAHLAAQQKASALQLCDLARLQDAVRDGVGAVVNAAREHARMAPVISEMLEAVLDDLTRDQAEAFSNGMLALASGSDLFAEQVCAAGAEPTAQASFLRDASAAWERAVTSDVAADLDQALPLEGALVEKGNEDQARSLAKLILHFAAKTKPRREVCRIIGLPHQQSTEAATRWRTVALDLNNRQDAVAEAATIFNALVTGFGADDELGMKSAEDLAVCKERLESGVGTQEWRRLTAAIDAANAAHQEFEHHGMCGHEPTLATPAIVRELHHAFLVACRAVRSDLPWRLLRGFILHLHNEFAYTSAALAFTHVALGAAAGGRVASEVLGQLQADARILRKHIVGADLTAATRAKRRGRMRELLQEIIGLTDDPAEKAEYLAGLRELNKRRNDTQLKVGFYTVLAVFAIIYFVSQNNGSRPADRIYRSASLGQAYNQPNTASSVSQSQAPDPDAGRPERQPGQGASILSRAELRWCQFQTARIQAAGVYLDELRHRPDIDPRKYNAGVDAFNRLLSVVGAACDGHRHLNSDKAIVDAEVSQRDAELKVDGQRLILNAVTQTASAVPSRSPAYSSSGPSSVEPPAQPPFSSGQAPASVVFAQGLADRQSWEACAARQSR